MKRRLKKYTSLTHYIEFLRRQPEHMQHIYAVIFAGSITLMLAFVILYVDYGFWHERYIREDLTVVSTSTTLSTPTTPPESPGEMLGRFLGEAKDRFKAIDTSGKDMLQGTETYTNDSQ
jgi:hypothetical protein